MQLRFISRGILPPALFIAIVTLTLTSGLAFGQTPPPRIYATIGPEAPAILRVLVGAASVISVQAGSFADVLREHDIAALVIPEEWAGTTELDAAITAGIKVVRLKRSVSVTAVEDNIHILGTLTGSELAASKWVKSINRGLDQIASTLAGTARTRVLILTPEGYTQGLGAFSTELIERAGGINVAAEAGIPEARQIDDTQVRQFAPDVVLLIGEWSTAEAQALTADPVYQGISAFDRSRIYRITPPGRDPALLVADVQNLADLLHPLLF